MCKVYLQVTKVFNLSKCVTQQITRGTFLFKKKKIKQQKMANICLDEDVTVFSENWIHLQVVSPILTSRYGRVHKPKVSNDFINYDPETDQPKIRKQQSSTIKTIKSPTSKHIKTSTVKQEKVVHVTADSIIEEFNDDLLDNTVNNNKEVRKFFKSPTKDYKSQYIRNTYIKTGILNGNTKRKDDETINMTDVLKIISNNKAPEKFEEAESCKKPVKTYGNKKRNSLDNHTVESFGLPDDPLLPYFTTLSPDTKMQLDLPENGVNLNLVDNWDSFSAKFDNSEKLKCSQISTVDNQNGALAALDLHKREGINDDGQIFINNVKDVCKETDVVNEAEDNTKYKNGELAWAKIGKQPYWPCLIVVDPETKMFHKRNGKFEMREAYHVRFFADNGRRAWVGNKSLLHFNGADDLTLQKESMSKSHKNSLKITSVNSSKWKLAVQEATLLIDKSVEKREQFFNKIITPKITKNNSKKQNEKGGKSVSNHQKSEIVKKNDVNNKITRKRKGRSSTANDGDVEKAKNESENLSKVRKVRKSYNKTEAEEEGTGNVANDSKNESLNNVFNNSRAGDLEVFTIEQQEALYKRNNIFRGITKAKVCQICEKNNDVIKCQGQCNSFYHKQCSEKMLKQKSTINKEDDLLNINQVEIINVKSRSSRNFAIEITSTDSDLKQLNLADKIDVKMKEIMSKCETINYVDSTTDCSSSEESSPLKQTHAIDNNISFDSFKCFNCSIDSDPPCSVCLNYVSKKQSKILQKCSLYNCRKFYHPECLKTWPQTQWSLTSTTKHKDTDEYLDMFVCPSHVCHTCVTDKPYAKHTRCGDKVARCLRCPAVYHSANYCLPAGTEILCSSQIVCPRHWHQTKKTSTINANWCFICSKGGNLICCETCPTSVHSECMQIHVKDEDSFICEDCESGRFPLYDEVVWVKLGSYRWWPAIIIFPNEIPDRLRNHSHEKGDFVVKFFGTNNYNWIGRGRVFLYEEGDSAQSATAKTKMDDNYRRAIEEASISYQIKKEFKNTKLDLIKCDLKPPPFIRIKVNKPVGNVRLFDGNISNTTACECKLSDEYPCGPDSDCLNRLLLTECNPEVCPAGERCLNQQFEKRNYPPLVPYKTDSRGWGLKCLESISKGQFVIEYVGEMIDEHEYQRRIKKMNEQNNDNYYFLTIDNNRILDAGPKGNLSRFMNHSCQPNCETQKWTVNGDTRVGLFAVHDIPASEELTFNYNLESISKEKKVCKCNAPNCTGYIGVKVKQDESQKKNKKGKKKKPPVIKSVVNNEPCFICNEFGEVVACQNKICNKYYHLKCVNLEVRPEGRWVCPWHNCKICTKRTIRCCVKCINSYCPSHAEGNVRHDKLLGFVCSNHDPSKIDLNGTTKHILSKPVVIITHEEEITSTTNEEIDAIDVNRTESNLSGHKSNNNGELLNLVDNSIRKSVEKKRKKRIKKVSVKKPKNT